MSEIFTLTINPTVDRSASVARVSPDVKLRCENERSDPGGGGVNVAVAIQQLGGEATACFTRGGAIGDLLQRLLEQKDIPIRPLPIAAATRENVTIYETETGQQFRFGMPGPNINEQEQTACVDAIANLPQPPKFLVLSGSLPPGVDSNFYERVIDVTSADTKVIVDTGGAALSRAVEQSVYLLKPNQRELGQLAGHDIASDQDARDVAKALIDRGKVQVLIISLGRGGVLLVTADEEHRIAAPTVNIKSKIGAGDSTVAGIVLALQRGYSLADAARFGVACGSAAVMTEGTELCRREDAERLYTEMSTEPVN